jgi:hypothetical protein
MRLVLTADMVGDLLDLKGEDVTNSDNKALKLELSKLLK